MVDWQHEEHVFKKLPDMSEINEFVSTLVSKWESKLNFEYFEEEYDCEIKNFEGKGGEVACINNSIRNIFRDLSACTASQMLSGVSRYIRNPYSKKLCDKIVVIHTLLETAQDKCFDSDAKVAVGMLMVGVGISRCIRYQQVTLDDKSDLPYISWYYGDYDAIVDTISEEITSPVFWMDNDVKWSGYNKESIVVVPIYMSERDKVNCRILRCYIKSVGSFIRATDVSSYLIVSYDPPSDLYIDNGLVDSKNIREIKSQVKTTSPSLKEVER